MSERPGLRERKKQQTRLAISQVATRLFIERGFDSVTMAEVAEAAEVSVNTIFNYFSTKEELFFDRGEEVKEATARIVRERAPGESILDALERALTRLSLEDGGLFNTVRVKAFLQAIDASPALRSRQRLLMDESEQRLAQALRTETQADASDPTPALVAALITGLEWSLIQELRARLLCDESEAEIRAGLQQTLSRGLTLLRSGVGGYGVRGELDATDLTASAQCDPGTDGAFRPPEFTATSSLVED